MNQQLIPQTLLQLPSKSQEAKPLQTSKRKSLVEPFWIAMAFSLGLAMLYGRVALFNLQSGLVGGDLDGYENLWNNYWVRHALFDLHRNPFFTDYLYYPTGISLRFHTLNPFNALFFWPLQVIGPIGSMNLQFLLSMALTCFCTCLLLLDLGRPVLSALAGAAIFTFANDQLIGFYSFGQAEKLSEWWLPLYLLCIFRLVASPARPHLEWLFYTAGSVGILVAMSLTDWQLLMYAVLITLGYTLFRLIQKESWKDKARIFWRLGSVGLIWLVIVAGPLLLPMLKEAAQNPWLSVNNESIYHSRSLADFFTFGLTNPGYLVLVLTLLGFGLTYLKKRNKAARAEWETVQISRGPSLLFWVILGLGTAILSLGPRLLVSSNDAKPTDINLPYGWFYDLPVLSTGRDPERFYLVTMLCVAVLFSQALTYLLIWFNQLPLVVDWSLSVQKLVSSLLVGAILAGSLYGFVAATGTVRVDPPNWPPFYQQLAQDSEQYAIMELPLFAVSGRGQDTYEAYQLIHGKPLLGGRLARDHKLANPNNFVKNTPIIRDFFLTGQELNLVRPISNSDILMSPTYNDWGVPLLNFYNIRYVVLYRNAFSSLKDFNQTLALVKKVLGPHRQPVYDDAQMLAYQVPSNVAAPTAVLIDIGSAGWYGAETDAKGRTFRWANLDNNANANLTIFNSSSVTQNVHLHLSVFSFRTPRRLDFKLDAQPLSETELGTNPQAVELNLSIAPGLHTLSLSSSQACQPVGNLQDNRSLCFGMDQISMQ